MIGNVEEKEEDAEEEEDEKEELQTRKYLLG